MPEMSAQDSQEIIESAEVHNEYPIFHDEGEFNALMGYEFGEERVQGTYDIDTCVVDGSWEMSVHIHQEELPTRESDEKEYEEMHEIYKPEGWIITLWEADYDPTGELAKSMHELVIAMIKNGNSVYEITTSIEGLIQYQQENN